MKALPHFDDPVLADIVENVPMLPFSPSGEVFHDLAGCLLEQQHPDRSTKGTFQALLDGLGLHRLTLAEADRFEAEALGSVRLSAQKRRAWVAAVERFREPVPDWASAADEDIRDVLGAIPGVGPWTVDVILLWTLGRPDIFPVDDYHLKKAMAERYSIPDGRGMKHAMRDVADGWRPYRSQAVRHLLAWRDWQRHRAR